MPKNYVQRETLASDDFLCKVDSAREKVKNGQMPDREKGDLLAKLDLARKNFVEETKPQQNAQKVLPQQQLQLPNQQKVIPQQHSQQLQAIPEQNPSQTPSQQQQKSPQLSNHNIVQQQKIQVNLDPIRYFEAYAVLRTLIGLIFCSQLDCLEAALRKFAL